MIEGERIAIEFFPICFEHEMLQLLKLRSTRVRCQDLEICVGGVKIACKPDQLLNTLFRVL